MDFFEHQEQARRRTGVLILYFVLALLGIVIATYALAIGILLFTGEDFGNQGNLVWRPGVFAATAAATGAVVFLASTFKSLQLSSGGAAVARELGGRELDSHTTDFYERRLLNVVEEMAIASGIPVPAVYVMDQESSINAFAAGKTTSDAVVGFTRGCMTQLSRDELQGVAAHEFSHILNGDMRLNMRLMGWLFGILFLALMGEILMRSTFYGRVSSSRRDGANIGLVMLLGGLGLMLIGFVGSFFAKLIKASISRQREYLADASAVQFTRNPDGLAGALKKIGGLKEGSTITHPMAGDASHLFFGNALSSSLLATHPPLQERIKRLLPHWEGSFEEVDMPPIAEPAREQRATPPALSPSFLSDSQSSTALSEPEALESYRSVHPEQVALGESVHQALPQDWTDLCRNPSGAQAVVLGLLLSQDPPLRKAELKALRNHLDKPLLETITEFAQDVGPAHSTLKLSLVDLAIPSLRHLSPGEYQRFRTLTHQLIASDQQVNLFEFALQQIVTRHLDNWFGKRRPPRMRHRTLHRLTDETGILLSTLSALGHPGDEAAAASAFEKAITPIYEESRFKIPHKSGSECGLQEIEKALNEFTAATPPVKRQLLDACTRSVLADGGISSREAELIRAIADAIGCPIPPFVRTAPLID